MPDDNRDPPSETQIGNVALGLIGARTIVSFADGTPEADACRLFYFDLRDALLQSYNWAFTITEAQLAADPTAPLFDRTARYALPADYLRLLRPYPESNSFAVDWIIQKGFIYSSMTAPLSIRYVARAYDPMTFSPLFIRALQLQLSGDLAEKLTQSNTKKAAQYAMAKEVILEAKRVQAIESVPVDAPTDDFLVARDSGWGPYGTWWNPGS